jgi:hypothetical protein
LVPDLDFLFDANPADSALKDVFLGVQPLAKRELRPRADSFVAHIERRQGLGTCATPCSWVLQAASCSTVDCECAAANAAGPAAVAACSTCIQPVNATLAAEIAQIQTLCAALVTTPPAATPTIPPAGNPCSAQCNSINVAAASCANDACFCPIVEVSGSACSQCYATVNITQAGVISSVMAGCSSQYPLTTAPPNGTPCSASCSNINVAATSCVNDACFCPVLEVSGSVCGQCWATVNVTQASVVASVMSGCSAQYPITSALPLTPLPPSPTTPNPCSAICNNIGVAATACPNDACFCPIIEASGSACSACYATRNTTQASVVSSVMSQCLLQYPPTTSPLIASATTSSSGFAPKTSTASTTTKVTLTAVSSTSGAENRQFGPEMFAGSVLCFMTLFAVLIGLISVW